MGVENLKLLIFALSTSDLNYRIVWKQLNHIVISKSQHSWYYGVSIKSFWIHLCLYIYTIFPPMSEPSHSYIISNNIENVKFVVLSLISWWYLQMDQFSISYIVLDIANLNFVFYIHSFLLFSTSYQYFFILWNVTIFTEIPNYWILIFHFPFYVLCFILFIV